MRQRAAKTFTLYDLQEMGGWKSAAMVRRYAHLAPAHMARHAAVVDGLLRVTNAAQSVEVGIQKRRHDHS
jgi:hypothetical protein